MIGRDRPRAPPPVRPLRRHRSHRATEKGPPTTTGAISASSLRRTIGAVIAHADAPFAGMRRQHGGDWPARPTQRPSPPVRAARRARGASGAAAPLEAASSDTRRPRLARSCEPARTRRPRHPWWRTARPRSTDARGASSRRGRVPRRKSSASRGIRARTCGP